MKLRTLSKLIVVATLIFGISSLGLVYRSNAGSWDKKDIVDTAIGAGSFKTLVAALKAADLVETLKGEGPFTVFAPTDEAFAKLPAGTLDDLLKPENKEMLRGILTYHVVPGKVDAAKVIKTDIATSNGVIHVIDTVVLPN
jgi:uncharacterized surface protein with fasciclin (FAS1) repeats